MICLLGDPAAIQWKVSRFAAVTWNNHRGGDGQCEQQGVEDADL